MEGDNLDIISRKERTSRRKEILEKKKVVADLIREASALTDPLSSFPDFHHFNQQGLYFQLESGHGDKLSRTMKLYIQKLLKINMERHFGTDWHAQEKVKYRDMVAPDARYILVYEVPTLSGNDDKTLFSNNKDEVNAVGFAQYRFTLEEEVPVLYVYELQLESRVQGKGLGKLLMQLLEQIARKSHMPAIMLTVQRTNLSAMLFYTTKLKYCLSSISPSRVDPVGALNRNYEILCKAFDQEAKSKLEWDDIEVEGGHLDFCDV